MHPLPKVSSGLQSFCQAAGARASVYQFCSAAGQTSLVAYRQVQCLPAQRCYPHHEVHRGSHRCQIRCQGSFARFLLDVARGPVSFCSRLEHRTCAHQGARVVLVLYSLKDAAKLSPQEKSILDSLGFPRPSPTQLECSRIPQPTVVNTHKPATPAPPPGCNSLPRQGPSQASDIDATGQAPKLIEVCAGSAMLSSTAINLGWHAVPLDQASCRFKPVTPLVLLDLRDPAAVDILLRRDALEPSDWVHMGLPCGTCSRARERPLPGGGGARPLRAADALFGICDLRTHEQQQVQAANQVYEAAVHILQHAWKMQALVSIENPTRSWLWAILAKLVKSKGPAPFVEWYFQLQDYDFDACMFGARRAKSTRIKATPAVFEGLQRRCDNSHTHLSWQPTKVHGKWVYPTKDEAEYSSGLCKFLCECAAKAVCQPLSSNNPSHRRSKTLRNMVRTEAGIQTKTAPQLIPEFHTCQRWSEVPLALQNHVKVFRYGGKVGADSVILEKAQTGPGQGS